MLETKRRFTWIGWLDVLIGFFIATRAAFASGIVYRMTLIYGVALLANGVFFRVAAALDHRVVRLPWLLRGFLFAIGAVPFGYAILLPLWSSEHNSWQDDVFFVAGLLFFGLNTGFSIWAHQRL
jgi:hypothetical protein